jgi:hypothetical protein
LQDKRDRVTVIDAGGPRQAYRVQTDTAAGVLRRASLTLSGKNLRPSNGAFQFEGEPSLEVDETTVAVPARSGQPRPVRKETPAEIPASPADTLHVLAALNEIGADVGEPIDVSEDAQHRVLVRATGLSVERRQEVAAVLKPLQRFEERFGGPVPLQEKTDRVLEASGSLVARCHAIEVLANQFPPEAESTLADSDREVLQRLRQVHLSVLRRLAAGVRREMQPLLPGSGASSRSAASQDRNRSPWQAQAYELMAAAQAIDDSLNRLLAGNYSQPSGEAMLGSLAAQLEHLDHVLETQPEGGR